MGEDAHIPLRRTPNAEYSMTTTPVELRPVHPGHGVHVPTSGTPDRAPDSMRRTSSFDMLRPDGLDGDLVLVGYARDLFTNDEGVAQVVGTATLDATVAYRNGRAISAISASPPAPELDALIGVSAASGFRAAANRARPSDHAHATLLHQLLDDVPVATLVSGQATSAGGSYPVSSDETKSILLQQSDYCAGWINDGVMIAEIKHKGSVPVVTGPVAGIIERADDPIGWHELAPLPIHGMRRRRRLDVTWRPDGLIGVDQYFRDSHRGPDGVEVALHEYSLVAKIDPADGVVLTVDVRAHVLPWRECLSATVGAQHLVGTSVFGLRDALGLEFTGTMSCTHLNDTMRSLEDVPGLAASLPRPA
jgi:hypothetical protein